MAEDDKKKEDPKPPKIAKAPKAPATKPKKLSPRIKDMHARNIAKMDAFNKGRENYNAYNVSGNQSEALLAEIIVGLRKGATYDEKTGILLVPKA